MPIAPPHVDCGCRSACTACSTCPCRKTFPRHEPSECCRHLAGRPIGEKHCRQGAGSTLAAPSFLFEVQGPIACRKTKRGTHEPTPTPPRRGTGHRESRPFGLFDALHHEPYVVGGVTKL